TLLPLTSSLVPYTTLFRSGDDVLAALLEVVLHHVRLHDRIHRAAFLAEAAVDALEQVDVVARGAAGAVLAPRGGDGDGQRRAHRSEEHTSELQSREKLVCR